MRPGKLRKGCMHGRVERRGLFPTPVYPLERVDWGVPLEESMTDLAQLYKALSEETRLRILALLIRHGELCVCDVEAALGATQSKASRHMRYLAQVGLVQDRRVGVRMHYRVVDAPDEDRSRVLEGVRTFVDDAWRWEEEERRLREWMVRKGLASQGGPVAVTSGRGGSR